jgi:alanine racemase
MGRPTCALIDPDAFVANYRYARSLARGCRALAVVKANAYGHGAVPLARALDAEADAFGVACSEEAMELRDAGIQRPILLMEGAFVADEIAGAAAHGFELALHSRPQLGWLLGASLARPVGVWLKIDSGMHRLGFAPEELGEVYRQLRASPNVAQVVLMSHFACADDTDNPMTRDQAARFDAAVAGIDAPRCLANSAAVLAWPHTHADWVRPGIMLYGSSPLSGPRDPRLRPVMRLESQLIAVHALRAGEAIGYGSRFTCTRPTRVGVVAIGYADGYPRHAADGTPVAVNGQRTQLIGRVSMDMLTVDITDQPDADIGDPVQLWGDVVDAAEVAAHSDTIAYQLFTGVGRRVHFRYR